MNKNEIIRQNYLEMITQSEKLVTALGESFDQFDVDSNTEQEAFDKKKQLLKNVLETKKAFYTSIVEFLSRANDVQYKAKEMNSFQSKGLKN